MPELPEVEALAAYLRERTVGHQVRSVEVAAVNVLKTYEPPPTVLHGTEVTDVQRHGKFLDLVCGFSLHLVIHLARAGWLTYKENLPPRPARPGKGPLALRLRLDDGSGFELTEAGTRKRLACYVVRAPSDVPGIARLGPDPLMLPVADFAARIRTQRVQLKGVLTDQTVFAGIGNAYSDEILHAARLSPFTRTDRLTDEQMTRLYQAVGQVLQAATDRSMGQAAATLKSENRSGLKVHARTGLPCPVCGDTVREVSFSDSNLQYCPNCQTGGRVLADRRFSRLLR